MTPDDWKLLSGIFVGLLGVLAGYLTFRKTKEQAMAEIEKYRTETARALADAEVHKAEATNKECELEIKFKTLFFNQIEALTIKTNNLDAQVNALKDQIRDMTIELEKSNKIRILTEHRVEDLLEKCGNCQSCGCPCPACQDCTGQKRGVRRESKPNSDK